MCSPAYEPVPGRDVSKVLQTAGIDEPPAGLVHALEAARSAFDERSHTASRDAHSAQSLALRFASGSSNEEHKAPGGWQKELTNSGLDGLITSSIVLSGCVGAGLKAAQGATISLGVVFVQGLALAIGEYLSARSYAKYVHKEFEREKWEMENYPEGEITEMIELFASRGMHLTDAAKAIRTMAKYRPFFINLMMTEELSLPLPTDVEPSAFGSLIMLVGFVCFGSLPTAFLFLSQSARRGCDDCAAATSLAIGLFSVTLFVLGSLKAKLAGTDEGKVLAGLQMLALGSLCALVSMLCSRGLSFAVGLQD